MCGVCQTIQETIEGKNRYFVRELETGYVVIGDYQRIKGYTLFLCKVHATEIHFLERSFRETFLNEMSLVAEAVYNAFGPDKLNYELLGAGTGRHMHWHIFPRRSGDTPTGGPVWSLGAQLSEEKYLPAKEELEALKSQLNKELDKLL